MSTVLRLDHVVAELASWIDSRDYGAAYLDPATGEVYPAFEGEVLGEDGEPVDLDDVDWRPIGGSSSREAYRDMEVFADAVGDPAVSRQLWSALGGKGAFRRFRDQMYRQPEEIGGAWQRYRDLRARFRAVEWLQDEQLVVESEATAHAEQLAEAARQTLDLVRGGTAHTVYLPDDLKARLEGQARVERRTEADIIRESLDAALTARARPKPRVPLGPLGDPTVAQRVDELLEGFGED